MTDLLAMVDVAESMIDTVMQDENVGRPVRIRWIDSGMSSAQEWSKLSTFEERTAKLLRPVETVGLWMGENEHAVMVGQSRDHSNENWFAAEFIYKPCIVSKEWLA